MAKFFKVSDLDVEILIDVAIKAFQEDKIKYGVIPPEIDTIEWHVANMVNGMYYKIVLNDNIVGAINLYDLGNNSVRIGSIFIDPEYQNQGIGTEAMKFIENKYPNTRKWSLDTPYQNYRNHYFYEKHGYVKVDEIKPTRGIDFRVYEYLKLTNEN
ncbi:MAG: GNAT family N-acetyltransferase [Clostridium sp.]